MKRDDDERAADEYDPTVVRQSQVEESGADEYDPTVARPPKVVVGPAMISPYTPTEFPVPRTQPLERPGAGRPARPAAGRPAGPPEGGPYVERTLASASPTIGDDDEPPQEFTYVMEGSAGPPSEHTMIMEPSRPTVREPVPEPVHGSSPNNAAVNPALARPFGQPLPPVAAHSSGSYPRLSAPAPSGQVRLPASAPVPSSAKAARSLPGWVLPYLVGCIALAIGGAVVLFAESRVLGHF